MFTMAIPSRFVGSHAATLIAHIGTFAALAILLAIFAPSNAAASHHRRVKAAPAAKAAAVSDEEGATDAKKSGLQGPYAAAIVMEPVTGTVIFEANDHQPWPTA